MSNYISREWLSNAIHNFFNELNHKVAEDDIQAYINAAPGADVRENIHGEWIREDIHSSWKCSRCNTYAIEDFEHCEIRSPFCPNCGADMRGKTE